MRSTGPRSIGPRSIGPRSIGPRSIRAAAGRWRDLRLPVKLALVMLVPMIVMVTLGIVLISGQLANSDEYARTSRLTDLSAAVRGSIGALQNEREQVATPGDSAAAFHAASTATDAALAATRQAVAAGITDGDLDPVAGSAWSQTDQQLGELPFLRAENDAPSPDRSGAVGAYSELVDSLFAFDRVLITGVADAQLTRQALALYDLFAARDEVSYQQAVVLAGIARHTMSVDDVTSLHGSEARLASRISDFRAVASQGVMADYTHAVGGPTLSQQDSLLAQAIDQSGGMAGQVMPGMTITIPVSAWNSANHTVITGLTTVIDALAAGLSSDATTLREQAGSAAGTATAALIAALAATIALMVLVARQLLRSIGVLRRTARDVASRQLPEAVERIRAGETVDTTVVPVGVHTTEEVGQLARAFDAVHGEALRLAVEQANLRANYSELFVNLSRRSQSLVQRQLRLIEQLERDEEDPDQLSALFKLDHLATRMRRNNENLMVLSGTDLARGPAQPVTLADLLRAGVSEIEHYQRIIVQPPPEAYVLGYAAGDLVRLLAELLDNATAFSSPDTPVTVASHRTRRRAIVIDIVDHGIGMSDEDLVRANEQLAQSAGVEERVSRRMGLFVISRLANQHGVRVRLHGGQDIPGLRVTITVPAELVIGDPEPPAPQPPGHGAHSGGPTGPGGPLPRRVVRAGGAPQVIRGTRTGTAVNSAPAPNGSALNGTAANGAAVNGSAAALVSFAGTLDAPATNAPATNAPTTHALATRVPDDPAATAVTVTIPAATSSGVGLFAPLPAEAAEPDAAEPVEQPVAGGGEAVGGRRPGITPIFDTLSAWFDDAAPPSANRPARPADAVPGWRFAADQGWQAVDAVAGVQPVDFTPAGLPLRQPRARLLPGSVHDHGAADRRPATPMPAEHVRDRLSGYQQGVQRGRHNAEPAEPSELPEPVELLDPAEVIEPTEVIEPVERFGFDPAEPVGLRPPAEPPTTVRTTPVPEPGTEPTAEPAAQPETPARLETEPVAVTEIADARTWASRADDGWRAAEAVADAAQVEFTAAGLPRRQPKARLLPGSVGVLPDTAPRARDADAVRERLNSFQRGARHGRDETTAEQAPVEHGFHW